MSEYRVADLNGVRIAYIEEGRGDPVVLLHGFASNAALNWRSTGWIDLLADAGRSVIAPDLRGHGGSTKLYDPAAYATVAIAADVRALCTRLCIARADVVGYSMGSRVAGMLALGHPHLVRSLVLGGIGESLIAGNRDAAAIADALVSESPPPAGAPAAFRKFAERAGGDLRALAACMRGQAEALDPAVLSLLRLPVLVAAGSLDFVAGPPEPLAGRIPGAQALGIPGRDHMLAVGDRSFKRAVLDFLGSRP
ncbi:MAG: alpha/beta fold hydrolase [Bauldia sp.]|nr:alpha/beta fold hydrolase [Bauldia sp.]